MRKVFLIFLASILTGSLFLSSVFSVSAAADSKFITGLKTTAGETGAGYDTGIKPMEFIAKLVGKALTTVFIGVTFLIIMIYAGFKWMTARGNEQEVESAKNIIIYAVIGLVVVLAGYAIVKLIIPIWQSATAQ